MLSTKWRRVRPVSIDDSLLVRGDRKLGAPLGGPVGITADIPSNRGAAGGRMRSACLHPRYPLVGGWNNITARVARRGRGRRITLFLREGWRGCNRQQSSKTN